MILTVHSKNGMSSSNVEGIFSFNCISVGLVNHIKTCKRTATILHEFLRSSEFRYLFIKNAIGVGFRIIDVIGLLFHLSCIMCEEWLSYCFS